MHTPMKAALVGLVLSLSSGAALADWDAAKARALAYHDRFGYAPLAFDGETTVSASLLGVVRGCTVTYRYSGTGADVEILSATPTPANEKAQEMCDGLADDARDLANDGISLPASAVRSVFESFDENNIVPELSDSTSTSETYTATIDPASLDVDFPDEMREATQIQVSMTFAKSDGRVLNVGFTAAAGVEETDENPAMSAAFDGGIGVGALGNGQPYLSDVHFVMNAQASGNGQNVAFNLSYAMHFTNVSEVDGMAAAEATVHPASATAEAGAASPLKLLAHRYGEALGEARADIKAHTAKAK